MDCSELCGCRPNEARQRTNWGGRLDYVLTTLSFIVGLDTVTHLPYMIYGCRGVYFWIPYLCSLLALGVPILYLEAAWGQFCGKGFISAWNCSPIFKGVGISVLLYLMTTSTTISAVLSWIVYYCGYIALNSNENVMAMVKCNNSWNTENCYGDIKSAQNTTSLTGKTPEEEFFLRQVLGIFPYGSFENLGSLQLPLCFSLLGVWLLVLLITAGGPRFFAKVALLRNILLLLLTVVLSVRFLTLPGSSYGVRYFFYPDLQSLLELEVWKRGLVSAMWNLGLGTGMHTVLASFNRFPDRSHVDVKILPFLAFIWAFAIGLMIFALLGNGAVAERIDMQDVMTPGYGIMFVSIPRAISHLPNFRLWMGLTFAFLFLVAISPLTCVVLAMVTSLVDELPASRVRRVIWRLLFNTSVCILLASLSLVLITNGGAHLIYFIQGNIYLVLYTFILIECLVLSWMYGLSRLFEDFALMYGSQPCSGWKAVWGVLCPLLVLAVMVLSGLSYSPPRDYHDNKFPMWTGIIGYMITPLILLPILITALCTLGKHRFSCKKALRSSKKWGPISFANRQRFVASLRLVNPRGVIVTPLYIDDKEHMELDL